MSRSMVSSSNDWPYFNGKVKPIVLGLAKKFEEVVTRDLKIIELSKDSPALHLLQRIRDEAHRFAVSYHRTLRSKSVKR